MIRHGILVALLALAACATRNSVRELSTQLTNTEQKLTIANSKEILALKDQLRTTQTTLGTAVSAIDSASRSIVVLHEQLRTTQDSLVRTITKPDLFSGLTKAMLDLNLKGRPTLVSRDSAQTDSLRKEIRSVLRQYDSLQASIAQITTTTNGIVARHDSIRTVLCAFHKDFRDFYVNSLRLPKPDPEPAWLVMCPYQFEKR